MALLERFSHIIAVITGWVLFLIGMMLAYEVVARYFFTAPTVWAEELSRLFMVWAVFLGSSVLIQTDGHIRVTVVTEMLPDHVKRIVRFFAMCFVVMISGFVAWHGVPIAMNSFEVGRTTGSMMDIPSWWMQASVPIGFGLIFIQAVIKAIMVLTGQVASRR
jgi:C4-dicarboxylate transporter DctQ subunit